MTTRGWLAILGATLVLGLAFHLHRRSESVARVRVAPQPMPAPIQKQIDYGDAYDTFLSKLAAAERIDDPLQRCLAMPHPPVSHWSHEVVDAYCRYSLHPPISRDEAHRLITTGRADELSRRLGELLQT